MDSIGYIEVKCASESRLNLPQCVRRAERPPLLPRISIVRVLGLLSEPVTQLLPIAQYTNSVQHDIAPSPTAPSPSFLSERPTIRDTLNLFYL